MLNLTLTKELVHIKDRARCGIIPYIVVNNELYFLCAVDNKSKDYSDFGGGVKRRETVLEGGIREFKEESISIFCCKDYLANSYSNTVAIDDAERRMSIIFYPLDKRWKEVAEKRFTVERNRTTCRKSMEVISIEWLTSREFFNNTFKKEGKMWSRLKSFFMKNIESKDMYRRFIVLLKRLYVNRYTTCKYSYIHNSCEYSSYSFDVRRKELCLN